MDTKTCQQCGEPTKTIIWVGPDGPWICPVCDYLEQEEQHELEYLHDRED